MTFSTTSIKKGWVGHLDDMDGGVIVYWHVHIWAAGDDAGRIAGGDIVWVATLGPVMAMHTSG